MSPSEHDHIAAIAQLNDRFRQVPAAGWVITAGVLAKGPAFVRQAIAAVTLFDDFPYGGDPFGERDFGAFALAGARLFWKIDYYDRRMEAASPDPADPGVTARVLTLMLAEEY